MQILVRGEIRMLNKKIDIRIAMFSALAIAFSITQIKVLMYGVFFIQFMICVFSLKKIREERNTELINLVITSLILPDNYIIIVVSVFLLFIVSPKLKVNKFFLLGILWIVLNMIINSVHGGNIIMFVIYTTPFFIMNICIKKLSNAEKVIESCSNYLKTWICIETVTIIVYALTHMNTVLAYRDLDWVTGTLGEYQCNVLMCIGSFSMLIFWSQYFYYRKNIVWLLVSVAMLLATGAIAYTLILSSSIVLVSVISMNERPARKIGTLALIIVGVIFFQSIMPAWITREVTLLTNRDYVINRITKFNYYENTFVKLPKEEGYVKFLIGVGAGQYSSRAAETCAGGYIGLYDSIARPYETVIRKKYISMRYGGAGLSSTSQASILSVQGEFGIVGLIAILTYFIMKFKNTEDRNAKIAVLFFVGLMFFDNTIEFAKYGAIFWIAYYFCTNMNSNRVKIE